MKVILIILLFILTPVILCYSQMYDGNYIISVIDYDQKEHAVTIKYDIDNDSIIFTKLNLGMSLLNYNIHMNDSLGNLIFYTNGLKIFDKNHQLMVNGDSLNYIDEFSDSSFYKYAELLGSYFGSDEILNPIPLPYKPNEYVFFHPTLYVGELDRTVTAIRFTRIDLNVNNGCGAVIEKNVILHKNGGIPSLIKHANGNDWWILVPNFEKKDSINFNVYVLDQNGISGPEIYSGGSPLDILESTNLNYQPITGICFSNEGSHFAALRKFNVDLFEFDRCLGSIKFVRNWKLIDPSLELSLEEINRGTYNSGVFSIDDSKLILKNENTYAVIDIMGDDSTLILTSGMYRSSSNMAKLGDGNIFTYSSLDLLNFSTLPLAGMLVETNLPVTCMRYNFTMFDNYYYNSPYIIYGSLPKLPNYRLKSLDNYTSADCKSNSIQDLKSANFVNIYGKTYTLLLRKLKE